MQEVVSIVVPVHNSSGYLNYCVSSLVAQTYSAIEILLVENGSVDQSYELCQKYKREDNRIKVFHLENANVSMARNYGISCAGGEYIAFVDSDDYCEKDWLMKLMELEKLGENQGWFPMVGFRKVSGYHQKILQTYTYEKVEEKTVSYINMEEILSVHSKSLLNTLCNKIYRRSVIADNYILMPEDMSLGEDLRFNLLYLDACGRRGFSIYNIPLYNYVRNGGESLDNCFLKDYHYMVQRMYDALLDFCGKKNVEPDHVFWEWSLWMYREVLCNTYSANNQQKAYEKYLYNSKVMKDPRLKNTVEMLKIEDRIGRPAYVGYMSRNFGVLLAMHLYEICKKKLREKLR